MGNIIKTGIRLAAAAAVPALVIAATWEGLKVRKYEIKSSKLSERISCVLLTDLHGTMYGKNQHKLTELIEKQRPDVIFMVGDIIDENNAYDAALPLLDEIGRKYPCYYVPGNHEHRTGDVENIKKLFQSYGVCVLAGIGETVVIRGQRLSISGADETTEEAAWRRQLTRLDAEKPLGTFTLLLSHRPDHVKYYNMCDFDLVLCGHAHGGQVRIPRLINGIYAPGQGLFPKFAGGEYTLDNGTMIVSRGLAINKIPRIFNPPEIAVIELVPTNFDIEKA